MSGSNSGSDPYNGSFVIPQSAGPVNISAPLAGSGNIAIGHGVDIKSEWENTFVVRAKDLILQDPDTDTEVNLSEIVKTMQERFLLLAPNFEQMEHYPALRDAYNQYKMLEKLLIEEAKNGNKDK